MANKYCTVDNKKLKLVLLAVSVMLLVDDRLWVGFYKICPVLLTCTRTDEGGCAYD
jgi:hypothetical protein